MPAAAATSGLEQQQQQHHEPPPPTTTTTKHASQIAGASSLAPGPALRLQQQEMQQETGHQTRRRTGSIVKRPRHLDDEPEPASAVLASVAPSGVSAAISAVPSPTPLGKSRRSSVSTATPPTLPAAVESVPESTSDDSAPVPPPAAPLDLATSHDSAPQSAPSDLSDAAGMSSLASGAGAIASVKGRTPTFPLSDAYKPEPVDSRRHPRDLVPMDVGFPVPGMEGKIRKEDLDDRLLMATCSVLLAHENRALCPKEIAEVLFQRDWLHNVGTTPFAHISTCIRSHLRRASTSVPPYPPILTSFELVGALTVSEVSAVGLCALDRPAVKRGALWYLDERVLGKGVGADDPFVRCRRAAGLGPSELNGIYVRGLPPPVLLPPGLGDEDDGDDAGMGRGKRKRRASSAAMAALTEAGVQVPSQSSNSTVPAASSPLAIPQPTRPPPTVIPSGRRSSGPVQISSSAPVKSSVPRLRLRLTALEEVDTGTEDSDGFNSDAARRRSKNKKKVRRATSEGRSRSGSADVEMSEDSDDDMDVLPRPGAFSSASSSALLAQSLLAASNASTQTASREPPAAVAAAVSPDSLAIDATAAAGPFARSRPRQHPLSMSAPNIFSAFPSARSPELMEVDSTSSDLYPHHPKSDLSDEDDFHEAMLRGEDFDFEWGSESYTTAGEDDGSLTLPPFAKSKPKSREMSIGLPEAFDVKDDADALSTPATTPRSPQEELESPPVPSSGLKMGMEATLCGAFAGHVDHADDVAVKEEEDVTASPILDRANSTDSLTSIVDEESTSPTSSPPATITRAPVDSSTLSVPLPSPLAIDLPPMLALSHPFASADYDFVGHEDDDRSAYRATQYDRDMAESADDEDEEDDDIVTVKIEEDGSVGPESTAPSSRASSVYPVIDSFSRRLTVNGISSRASSSDSSDDAFDPMMIVSHSLLASGLPLPQHAPSPPDTTDWAMHLDLDEFDGDLAHTDHLLGPEMVGLDELDLAWGVDETEEEWQTRRTDCAKARGMNAVTGSTFLTGSPECWTPTAARIPHHDTESFAGGLSSPLTATKSKLAAPPLSRSPSVTSTNLSPPVAFPTTPLSIAITSTIVERGIAVFSTTVVDHDTATSYALLRRIDVDYLNGSVLLRPTFTPSTERLSILGDIPDAFEVVSGGDSIEGTWIPLSAARALATRFATSLGHLEPFLEDDLDKAFPSPLPELKSTLRKLLASSEAMEWGTPLFAGTTGAERSTDCGSKAAATAMAAVTKAARERRAGDVLGDGVDSGSSVVADGVECESKQ